MIGIGLALSIMMAMRIEREIIQVGTSLGVTIPAEIINEHKLEKGMTVSINYPPEDTAEDGTPPQWRKRFEEWAALGSELAWKKAHAVVFLGENGDKDEARRVLAEFDEMARFRREKERAAENARTSPPEPDPLAVALNFAQHDLETWLGMPSIPRIQMGPRKFEAGIDARERKVEEAKAALKAAEKKEA